MEVQKTFNELQDLITRKYKVDTTTSSDKAEDTQCDNKSALMLSEMESFFL